MLLSRHSVYVHRSSMANTHRSVRSCNCRVRCSVFLSGRCVRGESRRGRVALDSACPIDRVWEHDIARMSYDPYSRICIPIHYAPVEVKIGTQRGATAARSRHLKARGTRPNDKSNTFLPMARFFIFASIGHHTYHRPSFYNIAAAYNIRIHNQTR